MYPSKIAGFWKYIKNKEFSEHPCKNKNKTNNNNNKTKQTHTKTTKKPESPREKNSDCPQTHCRQHHSTVEQYPKVSRGKKRQDTVRIFHPADGPALGPTVLLDQAQRLENSKWMDQWKTLVLAYGFDSPLDIRQRVAGKLRGMTVEPRRKEVTFVNHDKLDKSIKTGRRYNTQGEKNNFKE